MAEKFSLKDQLFNPHKVTFLAQRIKQVYPEFAAQTFTNEVLNEFPQLELKARIAWMREKLKDHLPASYRQATQILLQALPKESDPSLKDNDFGDFIFAPFSDFVAHYGCQKKDLAFSLKALKTITTRFSAEDAIRYFIKHFPEETLNALQSWTQDRHYHVRRLVSEGTRPLLPWSQKLTLSPQTSLALLDKLYSDPTRYVTRSVANHLNDLSKQAPDLVLQTLKRWQDSQAQSPEEIQYMIRHSLRTLIKQGHQPTLEFLGYHSQPQIRLFDFQLDSSQVDLGQALGFQLAVKALAPEKLVIDYRIHFLNQQGKHRSKTFKLKNLSLKPGEKRILTKRHPLKTMTTKKLYPGEHRVELQINGRSWGEHKFEIVF